MSYAISLTRLREHMYNSCVHRITRPIQVVPILPGMEVIGEILVDAIDMIPWLIKDFKCVIPVQCLTKGGSGIMISAAIEVHCCQLTSAHSWRYMFLLAVTILYTARNALFDNWTLRGHHVALLAHWTVT